MILIRAIYPSFGSLVGFFSFSFQSGDRAATVWDRQNGPTRALTVARHARQPYFELCAQVGIPAPCSLVYARFITAPPLASIGD
jgi:hypothetical protein